MSDNKRKKLASKKAKAAAKKAKIAKKMKALVAFAALAVLCGCAQSEPASRVTRGEYGDIEIRFCEGASSNVVNVTLGDAAYASADSKGSTETTTASPTLDVKPQTTLNYGLTSGSASGASWIDSLADVSKQGLAYVLGSGKANGTMCVQKKDGSTECVTCKDGTCTTSGGDCIACGRSD